MSDAALVTLAFIGLGTVLTGLAFHDTLRHHQRRYRDGNTRARICRVHKRGGMWFFRIGRFGGSFYRTNLCRKVRLSDYE